MNKVNLIQPAIAPGSDATQASRRAWEYLHHLAWFGAKWQTANYCLTRTFI